MVKAVVLGGAGTILSDRLSNSDVGLGGVGQPLSMLLKCSPLIDHLAVYDIVSAPGVATDLSHINTKCGVSGHLPADNGLSLALKDANILFIAVGSVVQKPGMTRDDLFVFNADIIRDLATAIASICPDASILVISNPVNSLVPLIAEVLKSKNVFNPKKLFGITTLDVVRASTFTAQAISGVSPSDIFIPVVGGHSTETIIPLFSQAKPAIKIEGETLQSLTTRVKFGGDEVIEAKAGTGSATLCMAYAAYKFVEALLKARLGENGIVQSTFMYLPGIPGGVSLQKSLNGLDYFSTNVELGADGAVKVFSLGEITFFEKELLAIAIPELKRNIARGVKFITES